MSTPTFYGTQGNTKNTESQQNLQALLTAGVPQSQISAYQTAQKGRLGTGDATSIYNTYTNANQTPNTPTIPSLGQLSTMGTQPSAGIPTLSSLAGQSFQFDPNQYLPQIQQQAAGIYDPQTAQLKALQALGQTQTQQKTVTTNADFDKQLQAKIESINQRGAFFGPGAINQQGEVETARTSALTALQQQQAAADAQTQGQLGTNAANEAQYIQQQLTGDQNSAYTRFQDTRNFLLSINAADQKVSDDNRNYLLSLNQAQQSQLNADRTFTEDVREFGLNYALDKQRVKDAEAAQKAQESQASASLKQQKEISDNTIAASLVKKSSSGSGSANTNIY